MTDETPKQKYSALVGCFVRAYGHIEFDAESDDVAEAAAIEAFKKQQDGAIFIDVDWNIKALPSIVSLDREEGDERAEVNCGIDFSLTSDDALQYAASDLREALLVAMPYVLDVLGNPEQLAGFKKGAVQKDVAKIRAAIAKSEGPV